VTAEGLDWRGNQVAFGVSPLGVRSSDRLLLVDDWIETGNQARAVRELVEGLGASLVGISCMIDHTSDGTRDELDLVGLIATTELPPWSGE
jgi:adenine phosphoribosyltransferase